MMFVFRLSFITTLGLFLLVLTATTSVAAAPQFGRPMFHATDVEPDKPVSHKNTTQTAEAAGSPATGSIGYVTNEARPSRYASGGKIGIALGAAVIFTSSML